MRTIITLSFSLALWGCPTPPDGGTQGGGNTPPAAGGDMPPPPPGAGGGDGGTPILDVPEADPNATVGTYVVTQLPSDELGQGATGSSEGVHPDQEHHQATIKAGDHVIFKGEIICNDCSSSLLIKVAPFVQPSDDPNQGEAGPQDDSEFKPPPFEVGGPGPFTMAVPKYPGKVVLEVLDDRDGNGLPSRGEKFTVLHDMGKITAGKNQSGLKIDFSAFPGQPGGQPGGPAGGPEGGPPPGGEGTMPPEGAPPAQ